MPKLTDAQLVILSAAARNEDGAALPLPKSLKIKGATAIKVLDSLLKRGLLKEKPVARDAEAWRDAKNSQRMALVISDVGLQAIDSGSDAGAPMKSPTKSRAKQPRAREKTAGSKPNGQKAWPSVRPGTKQALLIDLLNRKTGATIDEAVEATGWQAHSVRGAISGALKK